MSATFSEAIAPASVTGTSFVLRDAGGNAVSCHRHGQRRDRDPAAQLATHLLDHLHRHSALRLERNQRHGRRRPRLGLHWSFTTGPGRPPLLALDADDDPADACSRRQQLARARRALPVDVAGYIRHPLLQGGREHGHPRGTPLDDR